jgi:hypothetical protein
VLHRERSPAKCFCLAGLLRSGHPQMPEGILGHDLEERVMPQEAAGDD